MKIQASKRIQAAPDADKMKVAQSLIRKIAGKSKPKISETTTEAGDSGILAVFPQGESVDFYSDELLALAAWSKKNPTVSLHIDAEGGKVHMLFLFDL